VSVVRAVTGEQRRFFRNAVEWLNAYAHRAVIQSVERGAISRRPAEMLRDRGGDELLAAPHRLIERRAAGKTSSNRSRVSAAGAVRVHAARKRRRKFRHAARIDEQVDCMVTAEVPALEQDGDAVPLDETLPGSAHRIEIANRLSQQRGSLV
jgi:hypothetical protein